MTHCVCVCAIRIHVHHLLSTTIHKNNNINPFLTLGLYLMYAYDFKEIYFSMSFCSYENKSKVQTHIWTFCGSSSAFSWDSKNRNKRKVLFPFWCFFAFIYLENVIREEVLLSFGGRKLCIWASRFQEYRETFLF